MDGVKCGCKKGELSMFIIRTKKNSTTKRKKAIKKNKTCFEGKAFQGFKPLLN
jgi:hypothetical protein